MVQSNKKCNVTDSGIAHIYALSVSFSYSFKKQLSAKALKLNFNKIHTRRSVVQYFNIFTKDICNFVRLEKLT